MSKAIVILSGGQDSTTCLVDAISKYKEVEAVTFVYGQRHEIEVDKAYAITDFFGVPHKIIDMRMLRTLTSNALTDTSKIIDSSEYEGEFPNTFVEGRNALFILLTAIYAKSQSVRDIILGVSETDYSGYPDCREESIQSMNQSINLAMDYEFRLITPLMHLTKAETWELADELGVLEYVRDNTYTCYRGNGEPCGSCPACVLRDKGLREYLDRKEEQNG